MANPEIFYGPWQVTVSDVDPPPSTFSFNVSGSDNADGRYVTERGVALEVQVSGTEWTIGIEGECEEQWWPVEFERTTKFEPQTGLIKVLDSQGVVTGVTHEPPGIVLTCTSIDLRTDPIPNPYDFTIPKG